MIPEQKAQACNSGRLAACPTDGWQSLLEPRVPSLGPHCLAPDASRGIREQEQTLPSRGSLREWGPLFFIFPIYSTNHVGFFLL